MILGPVILGIATGSLAFVMLWSSGGLLAFICAQLVGSIITVLGAELLARTQGTDAVAEDRRKISRERSFARGRIEFSDGRSALDCIIHDLSGAGARLGIPNGTAPPEFFNLHLVGMNRTTPARVRWYTSDQVGVEFIDVETVGEAWLPENGRRSAG